MVCCSVGDCTVVVYSALTPDSSPLTWSGANVWGPSPWAMLIVGHLLFDIIFHSYLEGEFQKTDLQFKTEISRFLFYLHDFISDTSFYLFYKNKIWCEKEEACVIISVRVRRLSGLHTQMQYKVHAYARPYVATGACLHYKTQWSRGVDEEATRVGVEWEHGGDFDHTGSPRFCLSNITEPFLTGLQFSSGQRNTL